MHTHVCIIKQILVEILAHCHTMLLNSSCDVIMLYKESHNLDSKLVC